MQLESVMREQLELSGCTALVLLPVAVLSAVPRVRDTLVAFLQKLAECIPRYYERSGGRRSRGRGVRKGAAPQGAKPQALNPKASSRESRGREKRRLLNF